MKNMIGVTNRSRTWRTLLKDAKSHGWSVYVDADEVYLVRGSYEATFKTAKSLREFLYGC